MFPGISVNKRCNSHQQLPPPQKVRCEPWGNSGRKEYLSSKRHQAAANPYSESQGSSEAKNTGYWPQIAEVHVKRMISVSPNSYIFPYIDFPGGTDGKRMSANAGYLRGACSVPGLGRSPGEENGNPLQYSSLENPLDREAWWAMIQRVAKSQTQLKRLSTYIEKLLFPYLGISGFL